MSTPPPAEAPGRALIGGLFALWWGWGTYVPVPAFPAPAPVQRLSAWPKGTGWMGFETDRPPPRWGIPDILLGLLAFLVGSVVGYIATALVVSDAGVRSIGSLLGSWAATVAYLQLISRLKGQGRLRLDFGFRFKWIDLAIGAAAAFVTLFGSYIVRVLVANAFGTTLGTNTDDIFGDQNNKAGLVILALMAAVGAPLVEELLFRGLALRALERRLGSVAAVIGSAALFALLHYQWQSDVSLGQALSLVAGIAVYGFVFAYVTRLTGRLGPSIIAHMMLNGLAALVVVVQAFS